MSVIGNTVLHFSEEQAMLLDVAREFCRDKSPISRVREQLETDSGFDQAVWDEMVSLGWTGIALPESCGGSGMGIASVVPVAESMGRAMLGTPLLSTTLAAQLLLRAAGESQAEGLLAEIAAGIPATVALLENEDWGDDNLCCTVDDTGSLQGVKKYVADAAAASLLVVAVRHRDAPALAGVNVSVDALVTGEDVAAALRDFRLLGALLTAAEATGSTASCLETVVDYLKTRKQFGRLIGSYQALKHPTVDILTALDDGRSFVYHAASLAGDGPLDRDAEIACRMAKAQATDTLCYAGDRAVQFHGGMGFTWECDAQLYIRRAQWSQQQFGDARHHRKCLAALLLDT
jgi:alkylation response protein AidB-like acyl-CoA dehydrogenase